MYEIKKITVPIQIQLVNGDSLEGKIFVTEDLASSAGNALIEEFLNNDSNHFFPFESNAGAYRLINKDHLVMIRTEFNDEEIKQQTSLPAKNLVVHFTNNTTVFGVVYPLRADESRVSDFINQENAFILVYQKEQKLIINRDHIIYVNAN